MFPRQYALPLGSALWAAVLAAGCLTPGERADTGECPEGEVCSSQTPRGLFFGGASFADEDLIANPAVKVTAVGGRQTIELHVVEELFTGPPFLLPFRVTFAPALFEAPSVSPPIVTLHALAAGSSLMRVVEPDSEVLFDRLYVDAVELETVEALPPRETGDQAGPWALYRETTALQVVALRGGGHRLVDEAMVIAVGDASDEPAGSQAAWDAAHLDTPLPGDAVFLRVTAAGAAPVTLEIAVEDGIDAVEIVDEDPPFPEQPAVGDGARACFAGLAHAGTALERRVYGLPWTFELTGPAELTELGALFGPSCVVYQPTDVGEITISVTAPGATFDYTVTAVPAGSQKRTPTPAPPPVGAFTPGERARASDG